MSNLTTIYPNTFQNPNDYVDKFMQYLTGNEFKVLTFAVRHIVGFTEYQANLQRVISLSMFQHGYKGNDEYNGVGMSRAAIISALDTLTAVGLLKRVGKSTETGQRWELVMKINHAEMKARFEERKTTHATQTQKATKARIEKRKKEAENADAGTLNVIGTLDDTSNVERTDTSNVQRTDAGTLNVTQINPSLKPTLETHLSSSEDDDVISSDLKISSEDRASWHKGIMVTFDFDYVNGMTDKQKYGILNKVVNFLTGNMPKSSKRGKNGEWYENQIEPGLSLDDMREFSTWLTGKELKISAPETIAKYVAMWRVENKPVAPAPPVEKKSVSFDPMDENYDPFADFDRQAEADPNFVLSFRGGKDVDTAANRH